MNDNDKKTDATDEKVAETAKTEEAVKTESAAK